MHICVLEERKRVHADSGLLGCVIHSRSVPATIAGQEEHDTSVTGWLFGKGRRFQQTSLTNQAKCVQSPAPAQTITVILTEMTMS